MMGLVDVMAGTIPDDTAVIFDETGYTPMVERSNRPPNVKERFLPR